jgi:hypothetical protein
VMNFFVFFFLLFVLSLSFFFLFLFHHFRCSFSADFCSLGVALHSFIMKEFPFQLFQLTLAHHPRSQSIPLSFSKHIGELIIQMLGFVFSLLSVCFCFPFFFCFLSLFFSFHSPFFSESVELTNI